MKQKFICMNCANICLCSTNIQTFKQSQFFGIKYCFVCCLSYRAAGHVTVYHHGNNEYSMVSCTNLRHMASFHINGNSIFLKSLFSEWDLPTNAFDACSKGDSTYQILDSDPVSGQRRRDENKECVDDAVINSEIDLNIVGGKKWMKLMFGTVLLGYITELGPIRQQLKFVFVCLKIYIIFLFFVEAIF